MQKLLRPRSIVTTWVATPLILSQLLSWLRFTVAMAPSLFCCHCIGIYDLWLPPSCILPTTCKIADINCFCRRR